MTMQFAKAVKSKSKLRLGLIGPSGSGKTYSALAIAKGLGGKIAVIDTESGSASKYADVFDFDVLELSTFSPTSYVEAIQAAERAGYDVIIVDSLSHAWMGKDGALEQVDRAAAKSGNKYTAWGSVTPQHNALIDAMVRCKAHFIATMRSKTEYVLEENEKGKKVPRKIGTAPVQREGMEYEFDVCGEIDLDHNYVVSKSRCRDVDGQLIHKPGESFGAKLAAWLSSGVDAPVKTEAEPQPTPTPPSKPSENFPYISPKRLVEGDEAKAAFDEQKKMADELGPANFKALIAKLASNMTPPIPPGPYTGDIGHFRTLLNDVAVKAKAAG